MRLEDVNTWEDYKEYVKSRDPEGKTIIENCERRSKIIIAAMDALHEIDMEMCIYDLDEMPKDDDCEINYDYEDDEDELTEEILEEDKVLATV